MRKPFFLLVVLAMCFCAGTVYADFKRTHLFRLPDSSGPAPIEQPEHKYRAVGEDRVPDQYIVVLSDDILPSQVPSVARELGLSHQFTPRQVWQDAIKGFFVEMPEARARALSNNPHVKYVEENANWYFSGTTQQTNINPVTCDPTVTVCTGADLVTDNRLWHLDRADQNYADPTNSYSYCTDGLGVTVYVVDSGVNKNHQEFGGRVMPGYNATGDATTNDHMPADDPCLGFTVPFGNSSVEFNHYNAEVGVNSHGTAVASALGGKRVGIAKNVTIVPIKTSRCDLNSSRLRQSNHFYPENKTMFRSSNGSAIDGNVIWRCITLNGGTTLISDPGGWPSTPIPGDVVVDGGVRWLAVSSTITPQTTDMVISGLNWILSGDNTGPKNHAIVTMSTYRRSDDISGQLNSVPTTIEAMIRNLLASNITVIVSANNQNGDACDTSPSRMSADNTNTSVRADVITAGGSMIINRPWTVKLNEPPAVPPDSLEADGGGINAAGIKGVEPDYDPTKSVREARWICGAGDSNPCSNTPTMPTPNPTGSLSGYYNFEGGSNAGACVTLFAPAKNLFLATTTGSGNDYRDARLRALASGTSWSAPIVAGFAARILQVNPDPTFTPAQVRSELLANSAATLEDSATYPLNPRAFSGAVIPNTPNRVLRLADVNITGQPSGLSVTSSDTPTLSVEAHGTSTIFYQWYKVDNASGFDLTHWTNGAHFNTGGINPVANSSIKILGATSSTFQAPPASVKTGYWARVTNSCGSADTDIAVVTIIACVAPAISTQPQSVAVPAGTGVTLSVGATGTSLAYQWFIGTSGVTTTPIGGATSPSVSVTPSTTTTYWVRVSNSCGTVDSASATVTVQPIAGANFFLLSPPCRILDTRGGTPVPANGVMNLVMTGKCGVAAGATSTAINVTVVNPAVDGLVVLYPGPANTVKPIVSTINYTAGRTLANNARITIGVDGSINIFNAAGTPLDFLIDVAGYFK
jgi:hypothetical protein